jgi:hypothetical protein
VPLHASIIPTVARLAHSRRDAGVRLSKILIGGSWT